MVNRIYLHLVLHGIFRHMLRRKGREERIYHLACDIVAESIIDGLQYRCVMKARSLPRRDVPDAEEGNEDTDGRTGI